MATSPTNASGNDLPRNQKLSSSSKPKAKKAAEVLKSGNDNPRNQPK